VQVHGEKRPDATAGQRAAVNLAGVEVDELSRGQALVTPGAFEETRVADATIEVLPGAKLEMTNTGTGAVRTTVRIRGSADAQTLREIASWGEAHSPVGCTVRNTPACSLEIEVVP